MIHCERKERILMNFFSVLQCLLPCITAIVGDSLVQLHQHDDMRKALCDNLTHATIGLFTWINVDYFLGRAKFIASRTLLQSILCALISSLIDIDHFISARSLHLKDATSLSGRPFLHCTTIPLVSFSVMTIFSYYLHNYSLELIGWISLAAFLSHHTRDAARHGFWLWPLGSTPPLGSGIYLLLTGLLPVFIGYGMQYSSRSLWKLQPYSESILKV